MPIGGKNERIGGIEFPPDDAYATYAPSDPEVYRSATPAYVDTGTRTSPGIFVGGCPSPMTLMGSWGPGELYVWPDYLKTGAATKSVASTNNVIALPNGIAMIHWDTNNLDAALDGTYTVEMITGWGSYAPRELPSDYGWINGTIMNLLGSFQAPFIHIYYRKVTGTDDDGIEQGRLYFWELLLDDDTIDQAETLYAQLKEHIDEHWGVTSGTTYPEYSGEDVPEPLARVLDSVFYMELPSNQQVPTVASEYWSDNTAYPENNLTEPPASGP